MHVRCVGCRSKRCGSVDVLALRGARDRFHCRVPVFGLHEVRLADDGLLCSHVVDPPDRVIELVRQVNLRSRALFRPVRVDHECVRVHEHAHLAPAAFAACLPPFARYGLVLRDDLRVVLERAAFALAVFPVLARQLLPLWFARLSLAPGCAGSSPLRASLGLRRVGLLRRRELLGKPFHLRCRLLRAALLGRISLAIRFVLLFLLLPFLLFGQVHLLLLRFQVAVADVGQAQHLLVEQFAVLPRHPFYRNTVAFLPAV